MPAVKELVRAPREVFNDPSFTPTMETPVLFVHGINARRTGFVANAQNLRSRGYWVWAFDYGKMHFPLLYGAGDLDALVAELAANVDEVLRVTGANKVDLVAHSQGGHLAKLYIASGGAEKVRRLVAMGAVFHGTDVSGLGSRFAGFIKRHPQLAERIASPSAIQQLTGSKWLQDRGDIPDTDPRVVYTTLYSTRDRMATPHSTSILRSVDGADVANVEIPGAPSHAVMPHDREIAELTVWGLERELGDVTPFA
ncbi:alpha/beta fold hydrolase [Corynebacterium aquatimens]